MDYFYHASDEEGIPITLLTKTEFDDLANSSLDHTINWIVTSSRSVKAGRHYLVPDEDGKLSQVVVIVDENLSIWTLAELPLSLPGGHYYLSKDIATQDKEKLTIGWGLGAYQFTKYKDKRDCAQLYITPEMDQTLVAATINSTYLVRDLVNEPANEMMPTHLSDAVKN